MEFVITQFDTLMTGKVPKNLFKEVSYKCVKENISKPHVTCGPIPNFNLNTEI